MERFPLRTPSPRRIAAGFMLLAMTTILTSATSAQMVLEEISITSGAAYSAGSFTDYFVDPYATGSGISSVTISSQFGGINLALLEVTPGEFTCDEIVPSPCEDIDSLAEITALGDLTFTFVGDGGENDSVVIPLADYDPGSGQVGFPGVVSPVNDESGVATDATLEWTSPPAWVDAIAVSIEDLNSGDTPDEDTFFGDPILSPVTVTTWAPSGMVGLTPYIFELSYFEAIQFEDPRTTIGARDFTYTGAYENYNESYFTVPEPELLMLNAIALSMVFGIRRLRAARSHSGMA
jgi:hypothetical protein